jgi:phospholipid/cholesterol/gamma-HCH transport system substrate-binding protein
MKTSLEFKVGLMVLSAFALLLVCSMFVSNFHWGVGGRMVTAQFKFLGDLKVNAPVEYAGGIKVGTVKAIRIGENSALVDILITNPDLKLHEDSKIALYSSGLLGSRYVQINSDLGTGPELKPGDVLTGLDANNLDQTFSQLGDVMEAFEMMMGDPAAKESFLKSFDNMNRMTDQLLQLTMQSRVKVEKMIDDLSKSSGDVTQIVASAQKVSKNLALLTDSIQKNNMDQTMKNISNTMKVMNQLANDVNAGKGTVGALLKDDQMASDIKTMVEELKAHPWKLLWKK